MITSCRERIERGRDLCLTDCPAARASGAFRYVRVEKPDDLPDAEERGLDVVILDMNHGWPNLGHDSIVHAVRDIACDLRRELAGARMHLRALSFDVRGSGVLPALPGPRFSIYVGTGGPGHIDPHLNDGRSAGSQGIREDPSWEAPLFRLFDAIVASESASLLAVCHTFGVLCRWSGVARPVLRGPEKGGKSTGVRENILSLEAAEHPWFQSFARGLADGRRLRIVDNRLYDLIPDPRPLPSGILPLGYETTEIGGPPGDALTMLEFAREKGGVMPRVFAVNHHPEVVDPRHERLILERKWAHGEVSRSWYEERERMLTERAVANDLEARIQHTSRFTFHGPLRFHVYQKMRERAEALGAPWSVHEDVVTGNAA